LAVSSGQEDGKLRIRGGTLDPAACLEVGPEVDGVGRPLREVDRASYLLTLGRHLQGIGIVSRYGQRRRLEGAHLSFLRCLVTIYRQDRVGREVDRKNDGFLLFCGLRWDKASGLHCRRG
jgi:hypothetical protein